MSQMRESMDLPPDRIKSRSLVDEDRVAKEEVVDVAAEVPIPWRTSRRLQEAFLKSLQERSDSSGVRATSPTSFSKKKKDTSSLPSSSGSNRPVKRQHSPTEAGAAIDQNEICEKEKNSASPPPPPLPPSCINTGRKRQRKVHFADPLSVIIEEQKQISPPVPDSRTNPTSASASNKLGLTAKKSPGNSSNSRHVDVGMQLQPPSRQHKLPLSCFDLLCNHVGPRGWRCYRVCLQGESFCSYHKNPATTSTRRISVCT